MMTILENAKQVVLGKFADGGKAHLVALVISLALHLLTYSLVGNGPASHGIGKSSQLLRSDFMTIQLVQASTSTVFTNVEAIDSTDFAKKKPLDLQTSQMPKLDRKTAQEQGKQNTIFPIVMGENLYYFRTEQLTEKPVVLHDVDLPQNTLLALLKTQTAILHLYVNETGRIDEVLIEDSPLTAVAAEILRETFAKMIFQPGMIEGKPVRTEMRIEVRLENLF